MCVYVCVSCVCVCVHMYSHITTKLKIGMAQDIPFPNLHDRRYVCHFSLKNIGKENIVSELVLSIVATITIYQTSILPTGNIATSKNNSKKRKSTNNAKKQQKSCLVIIATSNTKRMKEGRNKETQEACVSRYFGMQ